MQGKTSSAQLSVNSSQGGTQLTSDIVMLCFTNVLLWCGVMEVYIVFAQWFWLQSLKSDTRHLQALQPGSNAQKYMLGGSAAKYCKISRADKRPPVKGSWHTGAFHYVAPPSWEYSNSCNDTTQQSSRTLSMRSGVMIMSWSSWPGQGKLCAWWFSLQTTQ